MKNKSNDYKLSAVNYYLTEDQKSMFKRIKHEK